VRDIARRVERVRATRDAFDDDDIIARVVVVVVVSIANEKSAARPSVDA
jgi:hypothetical protein